MAELADTQDLGDDTSVKESFDMKKFMAISFLILICVIFGACGDVSNVDIHNETSKIFSQDDITAAEQVWSGQTLTELYYPGDDWADEFEHWKAFYNADEAIVLLSSIDVNVDATSLKAGDTLTEFNWVLVRDKGKQWEYKDCGY